MSDTDTTPSLYRYGTVAMGKTLAEVRAENASHAREVYAKRCGFNGWDHLCTHVAGAPDIRAFPLPARGR